MVGGMGAQGGSAAGLTGLVRAAYEAGAGNWDSGPGLLYRDLAGALVANAPVPVEGASVLDVGAGTGAVGSAALAAGAAQVVAADLAPRMLARRQQPILAVAADAAALPFSDRSFTLAVAAFCLGHVLDVQACLAEVGRVCRALAASSFAPGWTHPAKGAVDGVLANFGYTEPSWYRVFKARTEPRSQDPVLLRAQASAAGLADVEVRTVQVETSVVSPADFASWRLGMAHVAPFVTTLPPDRRSDLIRAAEAAAAHTAGRPLEVAMLVLTARSPG